MSTANYRNFVTGDILSDSTEVTIPSAIDVRMPGTGSNLDSGPIPMASSTGDELVVTVEMHGPNKQVRLTVDTDALREREAIRRWNKEEK